MIISFCIGAFLFFYISNVNSERQASIQQLFGQPQPGDIYKIRYTDNDGGTSVRYFRVAEKDSASVFFYRGKLSAWNVSDVFLNDFDIETMVSFSNEDLQKVKAGNFTNNEMKNAQLVEIERRTDFTPANSL